ncbi:unnamed protein product, partial [marine sediment metagenome]
MMENSGDSISRMELESYLERLRPLVDDTIEKLGE